MKKYLVLPLVAAVLVGCTSSNSTTENAETAVAEANTAWQTADVQSAEMPSSMGTAQIPQPSYGPTYGNTGSEPQPTYSADAAVNSGTDATVVGNCQVARDGNNAPIYSQISKGCYTDSQYTVGKDDTLYLISYLSGRTVNEIATLNGISATAPLKVGQVLRVR